MSYQPLSNCLIRGPVIDTPHVDERCPIAPANALPANHAAEQMQGRRQRRTFERGHVAFVIYHVNVKIGLHVYVSCCIQPAKKRERLMVATDEHVLAVVHALASSWIDERSRSTTQSGARLEHEDTYALLGEGCGGTEAGKATPNHDDVNAQCTMPDARCSMPNVQCSMLNA
jgi:hypothetical protein